MNFVPYVPPPPGHSSVRYGTVLTASHEGGRGAVRFTQCNKEVRYPYEYSTAAVVVRSNTYRTIK